MIFLNEFLKYWKDVTLKTIKTNELEWRSVRKGKIWGRGECLAKEGEHRERRETNTESPTPSFNVLII